MSAAQIKYENREYEEIRRAIVHCLQADRAVKKILERHGNAITSHREPLLRLQAICLERTIRILYYLANANEGDLRSVAMHCYRINVDEADLIGSVVREGLCEFTPSDTEIVSEASSAFETLMALVQQREFRAAYAVDSNTIPTKPK